MTAGKKELWLNGSILNCCEVKSFKFFVSERQYLQINKQDLLSLQKSVYLCQMAHCMFVVLQP